MTATDLERTTPSRTLRVLSILALALATAVAFSPAWSADWILYDDPVYVLNNFQIRRGLTTEGFVWLFAHHHGGNFHPLTSLSHMLDCELFGLSPRGPHLVNVGLHVVNGVLVCAVLHAYTGAWWRSLLVAAFFALHPLRAESVAWVSERKDVLSACLFLLTLAAWKRWTASPSPARYALTCLVFALGLLAKPMLVTLPFVLLLLDVWPLRRMSWRVFARASWPRWREKLPLFGLALGSSVVTFLVQRGAGAVVSSSALDPLRRALNAIWSVGRYLAATVWPVDLAPFYPLTGVTPLRLLLASVVVLALVTALAWTLRHRRPSALVGWAWFVGMLVPVIGIVQVGAQSIADRYTYLPTIGLLVAVIWIAADVAQPSRRTRRVLAGAAVLALVPLSVATARQVGYWKDNRTLFAHAVEVTRENAVAHQNLGNSLLMAGEVEPGLAHLREALRILPDFPDAHNNIGTALGAQGKFDEAIAHFRAALATQPTAQTYYNIGFALVQAGRSDEARPEYERAIQIDPDLADARAALGAWLAARGRADEAVPHLERALALEHENVETHRSLAIARTYQGRVEEAIAAYRAVLQRAPRDLDARNNIAWIRATHADPSHRDGREAVTLAEEARDLAPEPNAVLFSTLAAAYAEVGRYEDAVRAGERAIELARAGSDAASAARFEQQLALYRARRAFHH